MNVKEYFIKNFQALLKDFNLINKVQLGFAEKDSNVLEISYKCQRNDLNLEAYIETLIFCKEGYTTLSKLGVKRIVFIDENRSEFEDISIAKLKSIVCK